MKTLVALLRGINVGGKNKLAMRDLTALVAALGGREVQSYIQSGNLIFRIDGKGLEERALAERIEARIAKKFGLRVPVVLRSHEELVEIVRENPYLAAGEPTERLHVGFLSGAPKRDDVAQLDAKRSPPDRFVVRGREIFLCCPNGLGRTKLTNDYFDRALKTTTTVRNWNTVLKLVALSAVG